MGMEFCPELSIYSPSTFTQKLPSAQCFLVGETVPHIRGGGRDPGIEGFLGEMDVLTKVLNPHYVQHFALTNVITGIGRGNRDPAPEEKM